MRKNGLLLLKPSGLSTGGGLAASYANGNILFNPITQLNVGISGDGVFVPDFRDYIIFIQGICTTDTSTSVLFQLRQSGGTISNTSSYEQQIVTITNAASTQSTTTTSMNIGTFSSARLSAIILYVSEPASTKKTVFRSVSISAPANVTEIRESSGHHALTTAYSGFRISTSGGSIQGGLSVYGVRS